MAKLEAGKRDFGKALLFVGCRDPQTDKLFSDELEQWSSAGAVKVYYAFSQAMDSSHGCKYVQDRLWREREEARKLFNDGARAYICGSSAIGKGVADAVAKMTVEGAERR
ncbi:MAG: hypothetical protein M1823_008479, partial [Watsoniomyces obsoletus]